MPITLVRNDITNMRVDAIVNAANESLAGGGGVDGAIHRAAGPELDEACRALGGCAPGSAKATPGFRLPAKYVIHTVGPVWRGGASGEREILYSCYRGSLELARNLACESVAFPLISTGAYGYPKAQALRVAMDAISAFLLENEMTVYIVVFDRDAVETGGKLFRDIRSFIDDVYVEAHEDRRSTLLQRMRQARNLPPVPTYAASESAARPFADTAPDTAPSARDAGLDDMLEHIDESFGEALLRKIDQRGITDAECYKRANVDRRLFNKIKNNPAYRPGKQTALAFAIALELSLDETRDLLMKAGFALSRSSKSDIVVEYCIRHQIYNIIEINEVLFGLDLQPLGY